MTNIAIIIASVLIVHLVYPYYLKWHDRRNEFYDELWRKTDEE